MKKAILASAITIVAIGGHFCNAAIVQWKLENGGNGHCYEAVSVPTGIIWEQADSQAQSKGGYLATITSAAENQFVFSLMNTNEYWVIDGFGFSCGPLIGGYQLDGASEPGGGWKWITGESFSYHAWGQQQPNNFNGQNRLQYWNSIERRATWQDCGQNETEFSYVIEYVPEPTTVLLLGLGIALVKKR